MWWSGGSQQGRGPEAGAGLVEWPVWLAGSEQGEGGSGQRVYLGALVRTVNLILSEMGGRAEALSGARF